MINSDYNIDQNSYYHQYTINNINDSKDDNSYPLSKDNKPTNNKSDTLTINQKELSSQDTQLIEKLKTIDQNVRAHEQAHISAGGNLVRGGATFQYQKGPDGKQYAVAGEVKIDASPIPDNPQATITKMQQVSRAALAPSDPSPQDRKVASEASQIQARAILEKNSLNKNDKSKIQNSIIAKYTTHQANTYKQINSTT